MKETDVTGRRNVLKAAGAGLVAAAVPVAARAGAPGEDVLEAGEVENHHGPKPVFLHGCGWNHDLPGVFGQVCLTFEMRAELGGTGVGTFRDDVYPEVNSQFEIRKATRHGDVYTFEGEITASHDPSLMGLAVKIVAEKTGTGKGKATITVGTEGQDLVVIAIIAILIAMLLPAVQ
jgi:hypothetical protein